MDDFWIDFFGYFLEESRSSCGWWWGYGRWWWWRWRRRKWNLFRSSINCFRFNKLSKIFLLLFFEYWMLIQVFPRGHFHRRDWGNCLYPLDWRWFCITAKHSSLCFFILRSKYKWMWLHWVISQTSKSLNFRHIYIWDNLLFFTQCSLWDN